MGFNFFVLEYITKSMVMICLSVKICDFLFSFFFLFFFFHFQRVHHVRAMSAPCQKKKKGQGVRQVVSVSVSDMCRTPVCRQKWHVSTTQRLNQVTPYEIYGVYKFLELSSNFKIVSKFPFYFLSYVLKPNKKPIPSYPFVSSVTLG